MGEVVSGEQDSKRLELQLQNYQHVQFGPTYQFGEQRIYISKLNVSESVLLREFNFGAAYQTEHCRRLANLRMSIIHPNLPKMIGVFDKAEKDWCAHMGTFGILSEYSLSNLRSLTHMRRNLNNSSQSIGSIKQGVGFTFDRQDILRT